MITFGAASESSVSRKIESGHRVIACTVIIIPCVSCPCPSFTARCVFGTSVALECTYVVVSCATTATNRTVFLQSYCSLKSLTAFWTERTKRNVYHLHIIIFFFFFFTNELLLTTVSLLRKCQAVPLSVSGEETQQVKQFVCST